MLKTLNDNSLFIYISPCNVVLDDQNFKKKIVKSYSKFCDPAYVEKILFHRLRHYRCRCSF
jgi:hypothetical protein